MVGTGLHVYARKGVHHPRHRRLPRAWLRSHRFLRSGYRRSAFVDRPAHRIGRPGAHAVPAIARSDAGAAGRRPAGNAATGVPKPKLMRRLRRTKIVATLGPASSDRSVMASLFA